MWSQVGLPQTAKATENRPNQGQNSAEPRWAQPGQMDQGTQATPRRAGSKIQFRLASGDASWDVGQAHQAWRYGMHMHSDDEPALVAWLYSLCTWVSEDMTQ